MSTTAAVYVEEFDATVRVNSDGYPDYMLPNLENIISLGLLEEFINHSEYSFLYSTTELKNFEEYMARYSHHERYIIESQVGLAFHRGEAIQLSTAVAPHAYFFSQDENFHYIVKRTNEVVLYENGE